MDVYIPKILRNLTEICSEMGVGEEQVKAWARAGAPIAIEGEGGRTRYSAEAASLQRWRRERKKGQKQHGENG